MDNNVIRQLKVSVALFSILNLCFKTNEYGDTNLNKMI
jgi:hypothetical protein